MKTVYLVISAANTFSLLGCYAESQRGKETPLIEHRVLTSDTSKEVFLKLASPPETSGLFRAFEAKEKALEATLNSNTTLWSVAVQ